MRQTNIVILCIQKEEYLRSYAMNSHFAIGQILIPQSHYCREMTLEYVGSLSDLVESLKFTVQDKTGIPVERISLMIGNELAPDSESLYDLGQILYFSFRALIDTEE